MWKSEYDFPPQGRPLAPKHGRWDCFDDKSTTTCHLNCTTELSSGLPSSISCVDGVWSNAVMPKCEDGKPCSSLLPPHNSYLSCDTKTLRNGTRSVMPGRVGIRTWLQSLCVRPSVLDFKVWSSDPTPAGLILHYSGILNLIELFWTFWIFWLGRCSINCKSDFHLTGDSATLCVDGKWDKALGSCKAKCSRFDLETPKAGRWDCVGADNFRCELTCKDGYVCVC